MVIVNVHFEPDLLFRDLRERLRPISPHWPRYCEPEEGRFSVWNQIFTEGDTGKTSIFRSFFPHVLEVAQPNFTRKDSSADGTLRTLSRFDRAPINLPMAEARDFHCYSHVSDNVGEGSIPSDHVAIRVLVQKPTIRCDHVKLTELTSWMAKHHPFSALF